MKKLFTGVFAFAAMVAFAVFAQVALPKVTTISPGVDLVQIIPNGSPVAGNKYATVSQLLSASTNASGLSGYPMLLTHFKNADGTTIAASAGAGVFGISITAGTSEKLLSEAANSNTKTDYAGTELVLPASYVAGSNITVTVNCNYALGSGTVGTHTLAADAYTISSAGVESSTLVATTAQTVPATAGTVTFTITGTTLVPGSRIWLRFTNVIQDTGASNITAQINSVSLS